MTFGVQVWMRLIQTCTPNLYLTFCLWVRDIMLRNLLVVGWRSTAVGDVVAVT